MLTLQELARELGLEWHGNGKLELGGVASLSSATASDLCFIQKPKLLSALSESACQAAIVSQKLDVDQISQSILLSANPQLDFTRAIYLFDEMAASKKPNGQIHSSAVVSDLATIGERVEIGALSVIEAGATVGAGTRIGSGVVIGENVVLGQNCDIKDRVSVQAAASLGDRCILHAGVVIGSDGFGLVMDQGAWLKIPQLGSVVIGSDVEIGANSTVDRGALDDTIIEEGCKLDNQIQVAHNVRIGAHTAIAACVGIAGSAVIGRYCKISGAAVVLGHLSVCDDVTVTAMSLVTKDIKEPGVYSSGTPLMDNSDWHKANARYKSIQNLSRQLDKHSQPTDE